MMVMVAEMGPNHHVVGFIFGPPKPPLGPPPPDDDPDWPPPPAGPSPAQAGSAMYAEDDRRWERSPTKEADKIDLQQFPDGQNWRSWRGNTIHAVVSAAGRQDDLAQAWIMQVEHAEPWTLEDPGVGWVSLGRKLAAALMKIAKGEIGRELIQFNNAGLNNNTVVRGRVMLAIVFGTFRPERMDR